MKIPTRRQEPKDSAPKMTFARRKMPRPTESVILRPLGEAGRGGVSEWELVCRDGWEWRSEGDGMVVARSMTLNEMQAQVVRQWIEKIRVPATWWAVSRELNAQDSSPEVAAALRAAPWLEQVLPVLLEASVDGAPPPP